MKAWILAIAILASSALAEQTPPNLTPVDASAYLLQRATLLTVTQGTLENADILIQNGKIAAIGKNLQAPPDAVLLDLQGKFVSPGLIDAHSHSAIADDVNECTDAVTAEVRIADVMNPTDIDLHRQLAGGLTTANLLHGSCNPIGGQNAVIKLRYNAATPKELLFAQAPLGIKFALGENVKQSNWGDSSLSRYPKSRMGVMETIRDAFLRARQYQAEWQHFAQIKRQGDRIALPPKRDLELEAIVEILEGKRLVHCHSYRADEILAMLRLAEEFGFKIATFQHGLEAYRVADEIAAHGAGVSMFSDWWAYKMEVYEAIPYNAAICWKKGVLVSFNSDSAELARRMNTEAAKAVKYGGVPEDEAFRMVTINPAKQLRIDRYVGSLEVGKHADLVVWSHHPLSTYAVCQTTFIDGKIYFDRARDLAERALRSEEKKKLQQLEKEAAEKDKKKDEPTPTADATPKAEETKPDAETQEPAALTPSADQPKSEASPQPTPAAPEENPTPQPAQALPTQGATL